jgi:hypothetical protein
MVSNEQLAQMIQIITKLQKQEDIHTMKNIVADKTIYAKKGLHVGDFNPAFDLFIKGNSCIQGDLIIRGNLVYENIGNVMKNEFCDVIASEISGFRIRSDSSIFGFMWNESQNEFVIADDTYFEKKDGRFLKNIHLKDIICRNISLETIISITGAPLKIKNNTEIHGGLSILENLNVNTITADDSVYFKSPIVANIAKIEDCLYVDRIAEITELYTDIHNVKKLTVSESITIDGEINIKNNLKVKNDLIIGKSIIFNGGGGLSGIAFSEVTPIENGSVSFINGKKISEFGDIITTEGTQTIWNKSLGNELDANMQRICNVKNPKENGDAVNKKYVDSFVSGCNFIEPVRLCSTGSVNAVYTQNSYISKKMEELIIDGVSTEIGDRILLIDGLYNVVSTGNKNQQWILQKINNEIIGNVMVLVKYGEKNARKIFTINSSDNKIWEFMTTDDYIKKAFDYSNIIKRIESIEQILDKH